MKSQGKYYVTSGRTKHGPYKTAKIARKMCEYLKLKYPEYAWSVM